MNIEMLRGVRSLAAGNKGLRHLSLQGALSSTEILATVLKYNCFLSDRERRKRRSAHDALTEIVEDELPGVEGGQLSALEYRDFLRAFATLPAEQRSVLLLIAVEDLSYEEAAPVLGVPIGTIMLNTLRRSSPSISLVSMYASGEGRDFWQAAAAWVWRSFQCQGSSSCRWAAG
jgi:hypothetical protein